ncbi:DedA family protein [Actinacidiphila yeochonensis]|uniref:DedA family protein n=1 Tax=Actinacidiphila yeochonensis TaxID=89050 RepID=UPI000562A43D|nr:DedA family protein [Actinacidiphila yeochonensis]
MNAQGWLDGLPPLAVYLTVGLVVGVESLGIPLPGEIVLITAALLASQGHADPWLVGASAVLGAVAGDSVGYAIGHKGGRPLLDWCGRRFPGHFSEANIAAAERSFERWGMWAVFFGRFVALLRIFAGPMAGILKMRYPKFIAANALGGVVWASGMTAIIYYVGVVAEPWIKRFGYFALAIAVLLGIASVVVVKRRSARAHEAAQAEAADGRREPARTPAE